jgi:cyclohexadieny/prephenate dehydrogenase
MSNTSAAGLPFQTIGIVGCGLIGCSIAAALKARKFAGRIVGTGRAGTNLETAKSRGHIDTAVTDLAKAARLCDLLVVCTPVDRIVEDVRVAAGACQGGTLITDAGSVKQTICGPLARDLPASVTFIGSHPIAGSEKQGCAQASGELFENRVCVLTPGPSAPRREVDRLSLFWQSLGMAVVEMSPEDHDRALAETSHVPHVVAAALSASLCAENRALTAGGFQDTTRIAAGDPQLWTAILLANADAVADGVRTFSDCLAGFLRVLEKRDKGALAELLRKAKENRDATLGQNAAPAREKTAAT